MLQINADVLAKVVKRAQRNVYTADLGTGDRTDSPPAGRPQAPDQRMREWRVAYRTRSAYDRRKRRILYLHVISALAHLRASLTRLVVPALL